MSADLKKSIQQFALDLGFSLAGFAKPGKALSYQRYRTWLDEGKHAELAYLSAPEAVRKREDTREVFGDKGTIIVLAYPTPSPLHHASLPLEPGQKRVAAYAWGIDYHDLLPKKTAQLAEMISSEIGRPIKAKTYTDTGPILERDLAAQAGLGWIGKNSCLINPKLGSFFLLAEMHIDLELSCDAEMVTDHCGSCNRCVQACPTACITPQRTLDAGRCISYLTIENKGLIPPELVRSIRDEIFGCDICQRVCPWNIRFSPTAIDTDLVPERPLQTLGLKDLVDLDPQQFNKKFKTSPIKRAKRRGMLRNAIAASGCSSEEIFLLNDLKDHDEALVRESARQKLALEKPR